jgi:hypothetical protein
MEQIKTNIENLTLHQTNYNLLPGSKIKLKNDDKSYIFIGYTNDNKYVIMNEVYKQIYNNTIICSSIENIII